MLDELVECSPRDSMTLASGRRVEVAQHPDGERLTVTGRGGRVELTVVLTEQGPRLVFESAEIELTASRRVAIACESLDVHASQTATIAAGRVEMRAEKSDVDLRANDRVVLVGEEVRLNCDTPDTVPQWMHAALGAKMVATPEANVFLPAGGAKRERGT
jgi:hypothetical protein